MALLVALAAVGLLIGVFRPQAEEVAEPEPSAVSESDVELYIKVYSAMQDDHSLQIEDAIKPYNVSLDDFRHLERRIQTQPHMVDRVREALLEHAKAKSSFAQTASTPTPETPTPGSEKGK